MNLLNGKWLLQYSTAREIRSLSSTKFLSKVKFVTGESSLDVILSKRLCNFCFTVDV
ncbi:MAG: PAP/fibrillin family protein [Cyanobacteria bacterium J06628_3]